MEKEQKTQRPRVAEPELLLQWGNRKRLRCVKIRDDAGGSSPARSDGERRATSRRRVIRGALLDSSKDCNKEFPSSPLVSSPFIHNRKSESAGSEKRKSQSISPSPEKEDRFYTTRGSVVGCEEKENGHMNGFGIGIGGDNEGGVMVLPRFFVSLSNKEKEDDFMAMKGCKLPQRPKKRSKHIQKCILLVSPGAWLTDLTQERYEVREKKSSKKRKRGLKAMTMESDSE
ncbi:uncharacterized protein A4U43_C03F15360 [Asparagus officinalis]|uniref:Uncharacterized protein n=1 Tax=Asparagus officinalis TaxID=4686 RepID=A0A5P1FB61_ASPOF|nr:uncharacterized protein LOC109833758 [Asparagus officinalis]ONK75294.1 uncharacterized protein A4U43_C03F15360 [Asparagus officinalis]